MKLKATYLPVDACIFTVLLRDGEFHGLDSRLNEINKPKLHAGAKYKMNLFFERFPSLQDNYSQLVVLHQGQNPEINVIFPSKAFGKTFCKENFKLPLPESPAAKANVFFKFEGSGLETFLFLFLLENLEGTTEKLFLGAPKVFQLNEDQLPVILLEMSKGCQIYCADFELVAA